MSDYVKRLEAVAEAARRVADVDAVSDQLQPPGERSRAAAAVVQALAALDALPAQPQGETVEVRAAVSWHATKRRWEVRGYSGWDGNASDDRHPWQYIATLIARVPLPVVPTIPATVTLPLNTEGGA